MPLYLRDGSSNMPLYLRDGSSNMSLYLRDGSSNMPLYLRDGSRNMPLYLRDGSSNMPLYLRDGSSNMPLYLRDGSSNMSLYLRDGSALPTVRAATLRQKLQIQFAISPSHSIPTMSQPVLALTLQCEVPFRVVTEVPIVMSLGRLNLEKSPRGKRGSILSVALSRRTSQH